jgi:hypothetical protein
MRLALTTSLIMGIYLTATSCQPTGAQATRQSLSKDGSEQPAGAGKAQLSKEQILAIKDAVALERGWFPQVRRTYDTGNALWKRCYRGWRPAEIEGHDYQMVMCAHAEAILDGGLEVVVDRNTGAVLLTLPRR